jgi:peptidyl-tRNA hydrolase
MDSPLIYILLNGELNMSPGKAAAQAAHAMASLHNYNGIETFSEKTKRTVIVLEASNQQQMQNLESYLDELDIPAATYTDEGYNEVEAYSVTAMAVGPIEASDQETRMIFAPFHMYYGNKKEKKRWFR